MVTEGQRRLRRVARVLAGYVVALATLGAVEVAVLHWAFGFPGPVWGALALWEGLVGVAAILFGLVLLGLLGWLRRADRSARGRGPSQLPDRH